MPFASTMMHSAQNNSDAIFEIKGLHLSFQEGTRREDILKGISLEVRAGETLGIVGESGSGKSLTALALGGLLPTAARVSCDAFLWTLGNKTTADLRSLRRDKFDSLRGKELSYIFQDPGTCLNPVISCGEQVTEAIRWHGKVDQRVARRQALGWLERVGLPDPERIYHAFPHELSGGQKQRVMIAAALCTSPRLLVADEPTTALDTTVQRHILDLIKSLKKELGLAAIFISHDLDIIGEMADRVMVMREGEVVEENTVEGIFSAPKHPYTHTLINSRPSLRKSQVRLPVNLETDIGTASAVSFKREISSPKTGTSLLQVEGLSAGYRLRPSSPFGRASWLQALDEVDFELNTGETLGIVGESGSGKSTLARVLLGLLPPLKGEITFQGKAISGLNRSEWKDLRKALQIVFQDPFSALNPRQRVGEALMEPLRVHGFVKDIRTCQERVAWMLHKVGLSEQYLNRFPHELSGGQRQRVSIARALVLDPQVLICDEAVSALDVTVQALVLNLLKDLQQEFGLSYLFISHDLAAVGFMSDKIMVMKAGMVVESGNAADLLSSPRHPYTQALLQAIPRPY